MLRDEAVAQVKEGLGFREDLDDTIVQRIKRVQRLLEMGRTLPWFLRALVDVPAPPNMALDFPEGFIREAREPSDYGVALRDENNLPSMKLRKMDELEATQAFGIGDGTSIPLAYYLSETQIVLSPRNHKNTTVLVEYFKKEPVLDTNIENKWLKYIPDLLIGNAGASLAKTLQDAAAYDEFSQLASLSWSALYNENVERKISARQYVLGRNS